VAGVTIHCHSISTISISSKSIISKPTPHIKHQFSINSINTDNTINTNNTITMPSFKGPSLSPFSPQIFYPILTRPPDSISSTPAGPSSAPTPASSTAPTSTRETLHAASAALGLTSQGLDLCPHCFREMSHCEERFAFA
jgi:hypothetical protein